MPCDVYLDAKHLPVSLCCSHIKQTRCIIKDCELIPNYYSFWDLNKSQYSSEPCTVVSQFGHYKMDDFKNYTMLCIEQNNEFEKGKTYLFTTTYNTYECNDVSFSLNDIKKYFVYFGAITFHQLLQLKNK